MTRLANAILKRLKEQWPTTLEAWDQKEAVIKSYGKRAPTGELLNDCLVDAASIIQLSRSFPALSDVIPMAFYHLSCLSPSYDDGNRDIEDTDDHLERGGRLTRRSLLSRADLDALYFGANVLKKTTNKYLRISLGSVGVSCPRNCRSTCSVQEWFRTQVADRAVAVFGKEEVDILAALASLMDVDIPIPEGKEVCPGCKSKMRLGLQGCRKKIWDALPVAFKPNPWD